MTGSYPIAPKKLCSAPRPLRGRGAEQSARLGGSCSIQSVLRRRGVGGGNAIELNTYLRKSAAFAERKATLFYLRTQRGTSRTEELVA